MALKALRRSTIFTNQLTPDPDVPTLEAAIMAGSELIHTPRYVDGIFTWTKPERKEKYELIAVSPRAMDDLGLPESEKDDETFQAVVAGQQYFHDTHPWSQAYAGWQFGQWVGQLGDGRAISLFEATNEATHRRYELQLKGAGLTPFSRFGDGKAVLRSSIREFLGSEAVNALGIPTTRALALTSLPETTARREMRETCAVVCRMAESWIRIGTFDHVRSRRSRSDMFKLADYCIEHVLGGVNNLRGTGTRYNKFFTEVVLRNAETVGLWQAYGFMNGVLNTDNTSILGLSIDFGPFAFMESFEKSYSPNHDDGALRYSYENQPDAIWWNLIKLGEDIGELLGRDDADDHHALETTVSQEQIKSVMEKAQNFIIASGDVYQKRLDEVYEERMSKRLGLASIEESDRSEIIEPLLSILQDSKLDYNLFFRRLGKYHVGDRNLDQFMQQSRGSFTLVEDDELKKLLTTWLDKYDLRLLGGNSSINDADHKDRTRGMDKMNPNFVLRTWIMDEVIHAAREKDYAPLHRILHMSLDPFKDSWGYDKELEQKYVGEPPKFERDIQCSCSS